MVSQLIAGKILKALYSAALAFCGSLAVVLVGTEPLSQVTAGQWVVIAGATIAAFGGTFGLASWAGPTTGTAPNTDGK